jgi:hypothetical protein
MGNDQKEKIDCFNCVHFAVTWEPNHPRSCKLFGFKTVQLPSIAVEKSSGEPCGGFQRKPDKK